MLAYTANASFNKGFALSVGVFKVRSKQLNRAILYGLQPKRCLTAEFLKPFGLTRRFRHVAAERLVQTRYRGGIFRKFFRGSHWPYREFAAAIGAHTAELRVNAICAERAFKRANSRVPRFVGQIAVAAFAVRAKFEHGCRFRFA